MPRQALGPTEASILWVTGFFPGVNLLGREVIHQLPSGAEVKNERNYTSTPLHMPPWHRQGKFYILLTVHHVMILGK